ncbi:MAG: hypothetical protein OXH83_22580 [Bryobacterales bacterium]|nr:hypothetical protein [Bryobacterales bacterium]
MTTKDHRASSLSFPERTRPDTSGVEPDTLSPQTNRGTPQRESPASRSSTTIASTSDLLRQVYDGSFKRTRLSKADVSAIRADSKIPAEVHAELLNAASQDASLGNTCQLMSVLVGLDDSAFTYAHEFARQVLKHHPAFKASDLVATLDNHSDAPEPEKAVESLALQDFGKLVAEPEQRRSKTALAKQCKENAIRCLLLWLFQRREVSLEFSRQLLQQHVWSTYAQRHKSAADQFRTLLSAKQASASVAFIISDLLETQLTQQIYRADAAKRAEGRAAANAERLTMQVEQLQGEYAASVGRGELLDQELANQKTTHADERAHLKDEYERLRGTVLRRLKDELALMEEGLHALQRDPPRVHVMVDHADRVIDGLRLEIDRLREGREA